MGKSKKRILNKNTDVSGKTYKRNEIINKIISDIKINNLSAETKKFISLFGITIEELSEAGADFEDLSALKHLLN